MKITFYRSHLCPRCLFTHMVLMEIIHDNKTIEIEEINVLAHPLKTWSSGIRIFPALKIDNRILSGVLLSRRKIEQFINESFSNIKHY